MSRRSPTSAGSTRSPAIWRDADVRPRRTRPKYSGDLPGAAEAVAADRPHRQSRRHADARVSHLPDAGLRVASGPAQSSGDLDGKLVLWKWRSPGGDVGRAMGPAAARCPDEDLR